MQTSIRRLPVVAASLLVATVTGLGLWSVARAAPTTQPAAPAQEAPAEAKKDLYPLDRCVIGGPLGSMGEPVSREIDGREVRFCCPPCIARFEGNREASHAKMDGMIVAALEPGYPLETCPVSGEKLGSHGEPVRHVHRPANELVKLCCAGCLPGFEREADKHVESIRTARQAAARDSA